MLAKQFMPGQELVADNVSRAAAVVGRVLAIPESQVEEVLDGVLRRFQDRHHDLPAIFTRHFDRIRTEMPDPGGLSAARTLLIGAYCTKEFALEAAALFNPSIVAHPDQTGVADGELRFLMSVRAVGEGHISSIEFRTGTVTADAVRVDTPGRRLVTGELDELGAGHYRLVFDAARPFSERVIYPINEAEKQGMEDVRFTLFTDDDGSTCYYGTYTAFDGARIAPRLIRTTDFTCFELTGLTGPAAVDKGMAIFPRKVGGRFVALSRWDRESIGVATSADAHEWDTPVSVQRPRLPWELIQLGNCGPPIETAAGWLVLTHGVGPVRTYGIGAMLLDLDEPSRLIGALPEPLLSPTEDEREGYVPNVVYSCGALIHGESLVVPYGCSDASLRFAHVDVPELLRRLTTSLP